MWKHTVTVIKEAEAGIRCNSRLALFHELWKLYSSLTRHTCIALHPRFTHYFSELAQEEDTHTLRNLPQSQAPMLLDLVTLLVIGLQRCHSLVHILGSLHYPPTTKILALEETNSDHRTEKYMSIKQLNKVHVFFL